VSFALTTDDALLIWDDGDVTGFPADTVVDADAALRSDTVASTPTGPWYDKGTPEHAYLTLYRLLPGAHVSGDAPEIPTYPDELQQPERVEEARYEPRLHPRNRFGRWIRVHFNDDRKPLTLGLEHRGLDLNLIQGHYVDAEGAPTTVGGYTHETVATHEISHIEELKPSYETGKLERKPLLTDGPAKEHLDFLFLSRDPPWVGSLTKDEQQALNVWTSQEGFAALNSALRGGTADTTTYDRVTDRQGPPPLYEPVQHDERTVEEWSKLIDSAIAKAPPTTEGLSLFVYRGVRNLAAIFGSDGPRVGQRITDRGYVSTTPDVSLARRFAFSTDVPWMPGTPEQPGILEIDTEPGLRAGWMAGVFGSGFSELTLPRGSTYEVTDIRDELGEEVGERSTVVEMKLVPPGESMEPGVPTVGDLLDGLERQAHANEATVTPVLQQVVAAQGGRMEGLHNRLKTREGIESKFRRRRRIMPDATDAEVAGAVNDALRYTAVFPDDRYVTGIEQTLEALRKAGFTADQIENFWSPDNNYVGVHALVRDRTGFGFELQFHTPESFETKQGEHVLYEQMRETDNPATARRLYDQMVGIAQRVVRPVRVEQVGVLAPRLAPAFG
jgi:ADP-ribosyltransferase exoenzyme